MTIKPRNSAREYMEDLQGYVHEAVAAWKVYADRASQAYAKAYEAQGNLLKNVKKELEEARKKEQEAMTFMLSLVTVGVAGPVAGYLAGKVATQLEKEAAEKFVDWAKDKAKEGAKDATEKAVKYLHPEALGEDPYEPAGVSPVEFMASMLERVDERDYTLTHLVNQLKDSVTSPALAKYLAEVIVNTSFIQDTPPDVNKDLLAQRAELALWIAWAIPRDRSYWYKGYATNTPKGALGIGRGDVGAEEILYKPLYDKLVTMGVPSSEIALWVQERNRSTRHLVGLWMTGFINWASSPRAVDTVFRPPLPKHADSSLQELRDVMSKRMEERVVTGH